MVELLKNRTIFLLSGNDSFQFLQNIVTNDLNEHLYSYNYLLSPHGRYLHDFFVLKLTEKNLLIDIDTTSAQSFLQKITLYKLKKDIEIKNLSSQYSVLYSKRKLENKEGVIASNHDPRFKKLGFRSIIESLYVNKFELVDNNLYFQDKYEFTIPDGANDLVTNNSLVSQFGAEELSAISFFKGCYIGQETISKIKYQGKSRKKLFKLIFNPKIIFNNSRHEITDSEGKRIGIFCSAYNGLGIGILNEEKCLTLSKNIAFINGTEKILPLKPEWR